MSYAGSHVEAFLVELEAASSRPHAVGSEEDAANEPTGTVWVPKESVLEAARVQPSDGVACAQRRVKFDVILRAASFAELEEVEDALVVALADRIGPYTVRWGNPAQYATTEGRFTLRREVEVCFLVYSERHITGHPTSATTSTVVTDTLGQNPEIAEAGAPP